MDIQLIWNIIAFPLGVIITILIKRWQIRYKTRMDAGNKLKLVFYPIIDWLKNEAATAGLHTAGRLKDSRDEIDRVITNFSVHLKGLKYNRFIGTCETFYIKAGDKNQKYYGYASMDKEKAAKEALGNIDNILKYVK